MSAFDGAGHCSGDCQRSSSTQVYRIEEGSLIVLRGFDADIVDFQPMIDSIVEVCGHDRFVIMLEPLAADIEVLGPADLIRELEASGVLAAVD